MWLQIWKKVMGWCTAQWKMLLFCAKTIVKESHKFELAGLKKKKKKKKKKEKHFGRPTTFWFGTFAILFSTTGCVVCHENTRRWTVGWYNGLEVSCFGDFEKFVCVSIYCVSALSLHIESTNSMIPPSTKLLMDLNQIRLVHFLEDKLPAEVWPWLPINS